MNESAGASLPPMSGDLRALLNLIELVTNPAAMKERIKELHEAQTKLDAKGAEGTKKLSDANKKEADALLLVSESEKRASELEDEMKKLRTEVVARQVQLEARERALEQRAADVGRKEDDLAAALGRIAGREATERQKDEQRHLWDKALEERAQTLQRESRELEVKRQQAKQLVTTLGG